MIGGFRIIGSECYLQINKSGTLQKLPKLKWYYIFYFAFKNAFKGGVHMSEIEDAAYKSRRKRLSKNNGRRPS